MQKFEYVMTVIEHETRNSKDFEFFKKQGHSDLESLRYAFYGYFKEGLWETDFTGQVLIELWEKDKRYKDNICDKDDRYVYFSFSEDELIFLEEDWMKEE